ncbi:MAG TPA: cytochrome C [Bacteroidetes bacterium]|nr:cytochrome C [Bacteroidota bacterium]HRK05047.1 cytochrome C [Chlorobiota bacterium]
MKYLPRILAVVAVAVLCIVVHDAVATEPLLRVETKKKSVTKQPDSKKSKIDKGRYLTEIGGCNDCHTDGFMMNNGTTPDAERLLGSAMGFKGPWGVTYPLNLRLLAANMTEDEWVTYTRTTKGAPPMPWWVLHSMEEDHLRAIHAYLRYLGPKGEPAPSPIPPGEPITTPYIPFEPVFPTK